MTKRVPDSLSTLSMLAIALLAGAVLAGACARRQTVASKSAAAYDEAVERGLPIGSGHGGHGHGAVGSHSGDEPSDTGANPMSGMDHADHAASANADDHSMAGMDHSKMGGREAGAVPAVNHSTMAGHDRESSVNQDRTKMDGDHSKMMASAGKHQKAGTEHPVQPARDPSSMEAGKPAAPPAGDRPLGAPGSNAEIVELDPAATLRPDGLDAPAPRSVAEAQKAGGGAHSGHDGAADAPADPAPAAPPGHDHHTAPAAPEGER